MRYRVIYKPPMPSYLVQYFELGGWWLLDNGVYYTKWGALRRLRQIEKDRLPVKCNVIKEIEV